MQHIDLLQEMEQAQVEFEQNGLIRAAKALSSMLSSVRKATSLPASQQEAEAHLPTKLGLLIWIPVVVLT